MTISVDSKKCCECGNCALVCPKGLLTVNDGRMEMKTAGENLCNDCGQCAAFCPQGAVIQNDKKSCDLQPTRVFSAVESDAIIQVLKQRRSYRNFSSESISETDLQKILDVVSYSPSGGNNRCLRWIITKPDTTKKFLQLVAQWFDGDCRRDPVYGKRYASKIDSILTRLRAGLDPILRHAPYVAFVVGPKNSVWGGVEAGIQLISFNLAAETLNIGCCFAGYAAAAAKKSIEVQKLLGIRDNEQCFCAMIFGYKTLQAKRIPERPELKVDIV